ncbi:Lipid A palmitoyltransferase PagP precursor [Morganella morganii]|nr:Lipid A palmitoyltransferase PagP precursor [Morganella morganii]
MVSKPVSALPLGVTARDDYHYIPIPVPLPLASVEYNRLAIQATYIPGTYNNGNVLFMWARWQF